ncbi:MAG TPA: RidA family protein [Devosia sp.]|jgi:enamine deaminase RidA (YjgF/YER057c/UK114 family)|uniref:RidA family protein n=1 Tax=Devosia sp. TaxID=1871048 RepID=UPI002F929356
MPATELAPASAANPYDRLKALGFTLPPPPAPIANFVTHVQEGTLLYLSGQGPTEPDGRLYSGKVGADVSTEQAYEHARLVGLNLIAVMHEALGDLCRVRRVVKLFGMVNATSDFTDHPAVINGCSDLFNQVFGDRGVHARSAVGFSSLPNQITVEIEAIVSIN